MRPPRIVILALFSAACLFLLCRAVTSIKRPTPAISSPPSDKTSSFRSFFSFSTPFTLFPPNAIITIADDNSTSFAARPAAFGPPLPTKGLNGQLWIGSGFTEESLQDGEGEGELGCSDVPGWNDGTSRTMLKTSMKEIQHKAKSGAAASKAKNQKRGGSSRPLVDRSAVTEPEPKSKTKPIDDGTDDYLHQRLDKSQKLQKDVSGSSSSGHADIQSIQEGAEIAGKIVLLSRGGCGFLEKVKWAQRRGAVGLVVGDNQRGGPLIQMYAHGDTSTVTIPSIFTSRTTAYLLSLMMQPGSFIEDIIDENGKHSPKSQLSDKSRKEKKTRQAAAVNQNPKVAPVSKSTSIGTNKSPSSTNTGASQTGPGWLARLFNGPLSARISSDKSHSASSSELDWVIVEDFSDEKDKIIRSSLEQASKSRTNSEYKSGSRRPAGGDDFQIGVEDWRDPDLIGTDKLQFSPSKGSGKSVRPDAKYDMAAHTGSKDNSGLKGGSTTPSSGEYGADRMPVKGKDAIGSAKGKASTSTDGTSFMSKIFGDGDDAASSNVDDEPKPIEMPVIEKPVPDHSSPPPEEREGLWVVITPSSGASPFFDTLLVLVVSPLITLTVVYALLILRARIRRRRWRAPKSVVERLPVRTYHTVASTPGSHSPRLPSPTSSSPTTPLLQSQHGPSRPRPRSRTTTGVMSAGDLLDANSALSIPRSPSRAEHEKRHGPSEWKKYMGRQVECVVCLEEYVDGGDVVRSLARGSPSSPRYEPYQDDSDDDMLVQAGSSNDRPLAEGDNSDVEQGMPTTPHRSHRDGWFSTLSTNFRDRFSANREPRSNADSDERER
ncbi:Uu.00g108610.m01.CDS01 [Anthostomella pinea]|uniref:Uu.00g108610.m01.CDS01 n=1 Tax=Anthostomella pinea TaxID=933095 RepID=A0AAI8VEH8_9PEZI|nr:Uu.00g108610.m01.CDS01 [Anthostomella pinea]